MSKFKSQMGNRQTGQIIPLGRNKYQIRVQRKQSGARRKTISQTLNCSKQEAETELKKLLAQINYVQEKRIRPRTIDDLLDEYLFVHRPNVREQTYNLYVRLCQYLRDEFGEMFVHQLTPLEVEKFLVKLAQDYAPETQSKIFIQLKTALKKAVGWGWLERSPAENVPTPKKARKPKATLTPIELNRYFETCPDRARTMWIFFSLTGARPQEVLAARWQDINFTEKCWRVEQSLVEMKGEKKFDRLKNESSRRRIPLEDYLLNLLKTHKKEQNILRLKTGEHWHDLDLVFPTSTGNPQRLSNLGLKVTKICQDAGITKNITPHIFRHTFATLSLSAGVNLKVVSEMLGHSSIRTTADTYLHPDFAEKQKASKAITELLFKTA